MPNSHLPKRLGFFTRLLEDASPGARYRFARAAALTFRIGQPALALGVSFFL